jgi:hypothetical protein
MGRRSSPSGGLFLAEGRAPISEDAPTSLQTHHFIIILSIVV